jgi:hypothetical protein
MWIFTSVGFFSVVEHKDSPSMVLVRARVKADADALSLFAKRLAFPAVKWTVTPSNDYRYRTSMDRNTWAEMLRRVALEIDYTNFKNAVHEGGPRDSAYMACWSAMAVLQDQTLRNAELDAGDRRFRGEEDPKPRRRGGKGGTRA